MPPRRSRATTLLVLGAAALACGRARESREELRDFRTRVDAAEAPLDAAIARFDAAAARIDPPEAIAAAREAAGAARAARDRVEALGTPPSLEEAHREELVYLNHVIPAFERFARTDAGLAAVGELRAILRRGRAHRRRGRRHGGFPLDSGG